MKVLQEYDRSFITEDQYEILSEFGIEIKELDFSYEVDKFADLFLQYVQLSDKDFNYKIIPTQREETLRLGIGYGIFRN